MATLFHATRAACFGAMLTLVAAPALADKVAVLPFSHATSAATKVDADSARAAARRAVLSQNHSLPTESEMLTAEMAVKDGTPDTSDEYRAAGRASSSDWTVSGRVDPHGAHFRLEVEVCQVQTGRVESLAREVDPVRAEAEIGEMLSLLLRPEGIGAADLPWMHGAPPPSTTPNPPPLPPATAPPPPSAPVGPPPAAHVYAEEHPLAIGPALGVLAAVDRPTNAQGAATALILSGAVGYALATIPGLELRADIGGAVDGPKSIFVDGGARYAFMLARAVRAYAGPELALGAFFTLGGDKSARFLGRGSLFLGIGIDENWQFEIFGDLGWTPGGAGDLVLAGGGARGVVRF